MPNLQTKYTVQIQKPNATITPLPMGGVNPQGLEITANNRYLTLAGKPWLPVMGEFHFSRYPQQRWEEELLKMKAGGITIVATYLFWIHLEEVEGQFDWSGNRNLHRFIELCGKHGLYAYPRIGPWAHGECRNGGFPDWLLQKCGSEVRQDAPLYLSYVRRYYQEIYRQIEGLLWKAGGPVIGIQIENELLNNAPHIHTLQKMAREVGFDVPIYTMTGWGPADVPKGHEIIPVFGGYPDAFWDRHINGWSRPSRKHYLFSYLRDDNTIGADLNQRTETGDISYLDQFPFGTCETGGGMQIAYHRRPTISADDIAALATVKVGTGSNLQGYYMYHGGANPIGSHSTMQESQATGYPNDLPVINYDFQAPIGQYGQVRDSYHALRPLHLFLQDFGPQLAPLSLTLPEIRPTSLDDRQTLRWAVRSDGQQGFLFLNNYQRIESLPEHENVQFCLTLPAETLTFPSHPIRVPTGLYTIWPFNLDLNGVQLKYATAQPICNITPAELPCTLFFAAVGVESEFAFDQQSVMKIEGAGRQVIENGLIRLDQLKPGLNCLITVTAKGGSQSQILLLTKSQAHQIWKANIWGQERVILSSDPLFFDEHTLHLRRRQPGTARFAICPAPTGLKSANGLLPSTMGEDIFTHFEINIPQVEIPIEAVQLQTAAPASPVSMGHSGVAQAPDDAQFARAETWQVKIPARALDHLDELFLCVSYAGDVARAYLGDQLIDDDFYHSRAAWEIGLSRFAPDALEKGLTLRIVPLRKDAPIYLPAEERPELEGRDQIVWVKSITVSPQVDIKFNL